MQIKNLKLTNFQLFKSLELSFDKINLITGENLDSQGNKEEFSGNGSGKTTILTAILFALFGEVTDIKLSELIRQGEKKCSVTLECSLNNEHYRIIRTIPNSLQIFKGNEELKFNTPTIAQKKINEILGTDFQTFRMYNIIDNKKGINILDLGITSLRKSLMDFVNEQFISIRQSLLSKKLERETYNVNKRLYNFYLSQKRATILDRGLLKLQGELTNTKTDLNNQNEIVNNLVGEINGKEREINYKQQEIKKAKEGICPILRTKCERISKSINEKDNEKNLEVSQEVEQLFHKIEQLKSKTKSERDCRDYYNSLYEFAQKRIQRTKENIMKLKEAQKFANYKYTQADVSLYADSIKTLDNFSSYYLSEFLCNLSFIINDLLNPINLSVEFSMEKNFIKINDNGQEFSYDQLSSGQKKFLGTIFKIGILLQEGVSSGILLFDEGLGDIDVPNFYKLIEILKELNFQSFIIYQNCPKDFEEVNYIDLERKDGESKIK